MAGGSMQNAAGQAGQIGQLNQLLQHLGAGNSSMPMAAGMSMMAQQPPTPQPSMTRPMMPQGAPQQMTTQAPMLPPQMMGIGQGMPQQGQGLPWQAMMR